MVELILVTVLALCALGVAVLQNQMHQQRVDRLIEKSEEAHRQAITLQTARITTLENRLQAKTVDEYAGLQYVPDELTKAQRLEDIDELRRQYVPHTDQWPEEQMPGYRAEDLEGEEFAGPTIG